MSSTMYAAHLDLKPIQGNFVTMIKAAMALPIKKERGARMDAVCGFTEDEEEEDAESQPALQLATQPERTVAQTDTSPDISSISDGVRNLRISQQAEAGGKDSDNGLKTGGKQSARDATQAEVETRLKRLPIQASSSSGRDSSASDRGKGRVSSTLSLRELMLPFVPADPIPSSELTTGVKVVAELPKASSFELSFSETFGLSVAAPSLLKPSQRPRTPGRDRTNMNDPTDNDYILAEAASFASPLASPRSSWASSPRIQTSISQLPGMSQIPVDSELDMAHKQEGRGFDSGPSTSSSKHHPIQRLQQQGVVRRSLSERF
eukprot:1193735-Prorocentrum_minimum.AAC.3